VALIVGAVIGYVVALLIEFSAAIFGEGSAVGAVLLNMAVFGAVIAYIMQMVAFVMLRNNLPDIERPYVSPLGKAGAIVAGVIASITLVTLFLNAEYRVGVIGCAIWFGAGVLYFGLRGRHMLVYSPEEDFAVHAGKKPNNTTG
jgi:ethanolamine permease